MNICDSRFDLLHTKVILRHLTIVPAFHRSTRLQVPPERVPSDSANRAKKEVRLLPFRT